jgi:hypothetical protein
MKKEKYMSMIKLLYGLAALPLVAGVALAGPVKSNDSKGPMQLSDQQMDKVSAGWHYQAVEPYNTGFVVERIYQASTVTASGTPLYGLDNSIVCVSCYLLINNHALSVGSTIYGGPSGP